MPQSASPPKTARKPQQRSVETVDQILAATVAVIEAVGVHKLTIDMVAAQAGISKGGILHHFPTRNAVIVAAIRGNMERMIADIEAAARSTGTFAEALALHVRRIAREKGGVSPALLVAMAEFPEAADAVHGMFSTLQRLVVAEGEAGSAERSLFLFAAFGILVGRGMNLFRPGEEELENLFRSLDRFAVAGRR